MITLPRDPLLHAAKAASRCAAGKVMPILGCLRIGDEQMRATDMEREIRLEVPGLTLDPFCVDATRIVNALQALPTGSEVTLTHDQRRLVLKSGRARYNLATLPAQDHPDLVKPGNPHAHIPADQTGALLAGLSAVQHAQAHGDVRYYLNGIHAEYRDGQILALTATDGHRLAAYPSTAVTAPAAPKTATIPLKAVNDILQMTSVAENVRAWIAPAYIEISVDGTIYASKCLEGKYPDWRRVAASKPGGQDLRVSRSDLTQALRQCRVTSSEKVQGVTLSVAEHECTLESHNPEEESGQVVIPCQLQGAPIEVGYRISYLLDALDSLPDSIDDKITLQIHPKGSTILQAADIHNVVMPIRL